MTQYSNFLRLSVFFLVPFIACGDWFAVDNPCDDGNDCTNDDCVDG